jgi:hypothetical protein
VGGVSTQAILLWIVALTILEIQHLKWIWWEYWDCRGCAAKHKDCACGATPLWVMYL